MATEAEREQYTADWRRWIAENLVRGVEASVLVEQIIGEGIARDTAEAAVAEAQRHPYILGALAAVKGVELP